jgi:hypothetical protein
MTQDPHPDRMPGDVGVNSQSNRLPGDISIDQNEGMSGKQQSFKYDDYRFQPKLDANNDKLRAQDQGFWESAGIKLGNLVPNIVGGALENIGYLGSLAGEWGDNRDYNNWLTQAGKAIKNPLGQVYRENPDKVWDPSDSAWWFEAFGSLVESAASFAIEGAGLAKVMNGIVDVAKASRLATGVIRGINGAAELSTAGLMAYTEGAQIGAGVFDDTYKAQYTKLYNSGLSAAEAHQQAQHIASQAAATTVQLNTVINTALNIPEIAPLFHNDTDEIMHWWKTEGKRQANESYGDWTKRIAETRPDNVHALKAIVDPRHVGLTHYATTAASEGVEEVVNDYAEARGRDEGKTGKHRSLGSLLTDMGQFFDDTMNSQGALDFVLGAVGGIAHPILLDNIPLHKVSLDAEGKIVNHGYDGEVTPDGKYKTALRSTRYLNAFGKRSYFDNVKDQVMGDIKRVGEYSDKIAEATAKGDQLTASRLKHQLFDVGALNSVQLGMGSSFSEVFKKIGDTDNTKFLGAGLVPQIQQLTEAITQEQDPVKKKELVAQKEATEKQMKALENVTEAMQKGYAKNNTDNEYKEKAARSIQDIKDYEKLWDDISRKYRTGDEWHSRYADYLFAKEIDVKRRHRIAEDEQKRINESEARRNSAMHPDEDPVTTKAISDIQGQNNARENLLKEEARINRSLRDLSGNDETAKGKAREHLRDLADRYGVTIGDENDLIPGAHQVLRHIKSRTDDLNDKLTEHVGSIEASTKYQQWKEKNPTKTVVEYVQAQARKTKEDEGILKDKEVLRQYKEETAISAQNLGELRGGAGRASYIKAAKATQNKIVAAMKAKIESRNNAMLDSIYNGKNAAELSTVQRSQYHGALKGKRDAVLKQIEELRQKKAALTARLNELNDGGFIARAKNKLEFLKTKKEIERIEEKIDSLQKGIATLEGRMAEVADPNTPDNAVLPDPTPISQQNVVLTKDDDASMESFIGNPKAYDDLMDSIGAIKGTDTRDKMVDHSFDLLMNALYSLDHSFLHLSPTEQQKSVPAIESWLERQLRIEGKIEDKDPSTPTAIQPSTNLNPTENPGAGILDSVSKLNIEEKDKANLISDLDSLEQQLSAGAMSIDDVVAYIKDNFKVSHEDAVRIAHELEKEHDASQNLKKDLEEKQAITPLAEALSNADMNGDNSGNRPDGDDESISTDDIPDDSIPPTFNIGQNFNMTPKTFAMSDNMSHDSDKVEDGVKGNVLTHEYFDEIMNAIEAEEEHGGVYVQRPTESGSYVMHDQFSLNPHMNPLWVRPGYITTGTDLRLVVDSNYDGQGKDYDNYQYGGPKKKAERFSDYTTSDGRTVDANNEHHVGNVPIKIVDPRTGETVAYLPTTSWITEQYPNAVDYRNVVDEKYDKAGNLIYSDNVAKQRAEVMELRKRVVEAHNVGMKDGLLTRVASRSRGHALRVEPGRASELLPQPGLRLALVQGNTVNTAYQRAEDNVVLPKAMTAEGSRYDNVSGVLIQDAAGRWNFEPIWTDRLSKGDVDTVLRAIEVYLLHGGHNNEEAVNRAAADAETIQRETGFDVTTQDGLENFINQYYYYTQAFDDSWVTANQRVIGGQERVPHFRLAVAQSEGRSNRVVIKAGVMFLGRQANARLDDNGQLNEDFVALLQDEGVGMRSRFKNVVYSRPERNVRGINSDGAVRQVTYRPNSGDFSTKEHASYNDMIKASAMTTLYGKLQSSDGSYVYYAHPVTLLDKGVTMEQRVAAPARRRRVVPKETEEKAVKTDEISPERKDYLDNLPDQINFYDAPKHNVVGPTSSSGTIEGMEANLENLRKLRSFTPIQNRNDVTEAEALEALDRLGNRVIPKGYNPFHSC